MSAVIEKQWQAHGLDCLVLFVHGRHYCGYVAVPERHPWHDRDYDVPDVDVHGGLTFGGEMTSTAIGGWWLGFDCAHYGDWSKWAPEGHRWTVDEVAAEVERLAEQVASAQVPA